MSDGYFALDPNIKPMLADLGISPIRVLRRAQLPTDLFSRGSVALPPDEYFRLWEALDAEGGERDLAVEIGRSISAEMFNPSIFAALCSPDLDTATQRIATYKPLVGPMRIEIDHGPDGMTIRYRWPAGMQPPQLLVIAELVFWAALARIATRHHVRPLKVSAPQQPRDPDGLAEFFGTRVHVDPVQAITFSNDDIRRPFLTENEQMWRFFVPELRRRLSDLQAAASVADRVRTALHETLPAGGSSITAVTRRLAVSSRTLQRQLQLEGTTFQQVLAGTREDLALHYLHHSSMRTAEIAYLLGYDDSSSFYRAFRTWTGSTPDAVRAATSAAAS
jgi:AraC-like DNA-binding protein